MSRRSFLGLVVLLISAVPIATWWLIGDQSEPKGDTYVVRPVSLTSAQSAAVGGGATAVVVSTLVLLASPLGRPGRRPGDVRVFAPIVGLGAFGGYAYRVLTTAVVGANIGSGVIALQGLVVVPLLLITSVNAARSRR